ncbi:MAG: hypothetical protein Q4D15_05550 [Lachnospiraceae bacterium]|nr:hypothetical protein [Lachnospiraceae bacterium]
MAKSKGVSGKTHTKAQLDHYANQHNPNNKAYIANKMNEQKTSSSKKKNGHYHDYGVEPESLGWFDG